MAARPRKPRVVEPARVVERGDVYFVCQPRVEQRVLKRLPDVQRTFMLLRPAGTGHYRRILLGHKRMPRLGVQGRRERFWCYVDRVGGMSRITDGLDPYTYVTETRGERFQPGARVVAAGRYELTLHASHTHLSYTLDAYDEQSTLLASLCIARSASYIVLAMRPRLGLRGWREWSAMPEELKTRFGEKRFVQATPAFLDFEGANVVLVGGSGRVRTSIELEPSELAERSPGAFTAVPENPPIQLALELRLAQA